MLFSQATLVLALATSATAHMRLKYPVPYGQDTLTSSPLEPADFPCKQRTGVYDVTEMNQWNAGETKTIAFTGSAVHGGGSCQFSITTDPKPSEQSQWKVIESVVGGCPSNVSGNLPEEVPSGSGDGAATFPVTMPSNIPDGQYTFAWTWLNKVGNREFYMNCAPVQVGSGSGSGSTESAASALATLPDMFIANLPNTECSTTEGEDFNYPDPGKSLIEGNGASLGDTLTGAGCSTQTKLGAGNGQIGTPSQATSASGQPAATSAPASSAAQESSVASSVPGVFAPGASSAAAAVPTAAEPTTTAAAEPVATAPPTQSSSPDSNTTTPSSDCTPCTTDGAVVCIGTNQFGLCNRGCAVAQDLAAGMACSNGVVVAATKRSFNFPRAHLHRRHGSSRFF